MIKNLENILIEFFPTKKYYGNPQPLFKNNYIPMRKTLAGIMRHSILEDVLVKKFFPKTFDYKFII